MYHSLAPPPCCCVSRSNDRFDLLIERNLLNMIERIGALLIQPFNLRTRRLEMRLDFRRVAHADNVRAILIRIEALQSSIEMHPVIQVKVNPFDTAGSPNR